MESPADIIDRLHDQHEYSTGGRTMTHQCDVTNAHHAGKAQWLCPECKKDISLAYILYYEATHPEEMKQLAELSSNLTYAFNRGLEAGGVGDLTNPVLATHAEHMAYRNGWMAGSKKRYDKQA
jgi:hypothetical protein